MGNVVKLQWSDSSNNRKSSWAKEVIEAVCEKHGPYQTSVMLLGGQAVQLPCARCAADRQAAEDEQRRQEIRKFEAAARFTDADIPRRFHGKTLDNWRAEKPGQREILRGCREYACSLPDVMATGRSMIFLGGYGTGKTHLAIGILVDALKHGLSGRYTSVAELSARVKSTYRNDGETENSVIESFSIPDLLVLDEVGVQFGTNAELLILFRVLNKRYENMRPTIMISNVAAAELGKFIGERIVDRFCENGGCVMKFDWESARK